MAAEAALTLTLRGGRFAARISRQGAAVYGYAASPWRSVLLRLLRDIEIV